MRSQEFEFIASLPNWVKKYHKGEVEELRRYLELGRRHPELDSTYGKEWFVIVVRGLQAERRRHYLNMYRSHRRWA